MVQFVEPVQTASRSRTAYLWCIRSGTPGHRPGLDRQLGEDLRPRRRRRMDRGRALGVGVVDEADRDAALGRRPQLGGDGLPDRARQAGCRRAPAPGCAAASRRKAATRPATSSARCPPSVSGEDIHRAILTQVPRRSGPRPTGTMRPPVNPEGAKLAVDTSEVSKLDVEPGTLPETMAAWVIREEREGEPKDAFQLEQIEVPEPGAFEVIVRVMAAGVNFNNVWAALGKPVSVFGYGDHPEYGHHIGGSDASGIVWKVGEGVTRWKPGDEVVDPLQPGLLRGRRGPRPRPARRAEPEDLGLRDDLGLLRPVHQGAGPAAPPPPPEPLLGRVLRLRPHLLHRLPDADRPVQAAAGPQRADLGRRRRPRRLRRAALQGAPAPTRSASSPPTRRASWSSSSAPSTTSTAPSSAR